MKFNKGYPLKEPKAPILKELYVYLNSDTNKYHITEGASHSGASNIWLSEEEYDTEALARTAITAYNNSITQDYQDRLADYNYYRNNFSEVQPS